MGSSVHFDNKEKDIFILREGPTQGLDRVKSTAETKYLINFMQPRKNLC